MTVIKLPTGPADALDVTAHYLLPEDRTWQSEPVARVLWTVATYHPLRVSLHAPDAAGIVVTFTDPADVPSWVPSPPASWFALVAQLRTEVGL